MPEIYINFQQNSEKAGANLNGFDELRQLILAFSAS
jgi:hypothetical protein